VCPANGNRSANNIGGEAYVLKLRQVPTLSVEDMLIQYNVTTKRERWGSYYILNILTCSKNGLWRKSEVNKTFPSFTHKIEESMEPMRNGLVAQIVRYPQSHIYDLARLGEAWRFRRTFERGQALMKSQDAWCLKAQAAASTRTLSLLEGEEFPSNIELDVIVGIDG
jgi:hypothetical protein